MPTCESDLMVGWVTPLIRTFAEYAVPPGPPKSRSTSTKYHCPTVTVMLEKPLSARKRSYLHLPLALSRQKSKWFAP